MALRELCEPNSLELKTHRDNVAAGGCCAAAAAHEPSEGSSVCLERGPPDSAASAECEVEGELSIPEGCDALSLVQVRGIDRVHPVAPESFVNLFHHFRCSGMCWIAAMQIMQKAPPALARFLGALSNHRLQSSV